MTIAPLWVQINAAKADLASHAENMHILRTGPWWDRWMLPLHWLDGWMLRRRLAELEARRKWRKDGHADR